MIVNVLGLGESLSEYTPGDNISFGVNDINRFRKVDYLVCVDKREAFTEDRRRYIENNTAKILFTQLDEWSNLKNFQKITLQNRYPDYECNLDLPDYPKSVYSPFIAISLAYKLFQPNEIHLFGVDINTHKHLSDPITSQRIVRHTRNLKTALDLHFCKLIVHGHGLLTHLE